MKTKIDLDKIAEMTYVEYEKMFRKEVIRAQKIGQTNCVVLSDFEFIDQTVGTLVVLGHHTGALAKFYKQIKKSRKAKKDFAVGTAVFEKHPNASSTLHINLEEGKAKPKKLLKNGKKLFKKAGLVVDIFVGQSVEGQNNMLSVPEQQSIEEEAQKESEKRSMSKLLKEYVEQLALVKDNAIPNLQQHKTLPRDLQLVRQLYIIIEAIEAEVPTMTAKQQAKWGDKATAIINKQQQIANLYKQVKAALAATNNGIDLTVIIDPPYHTYYELVEQAMAPVDPLVHMLQAFVQETQKPTENTITHSQQVLATLKDLIAKSAPYKEQSRVKEITTAHHQLETAYNSYTAWKAEQERLRIYLEEAQEAVQKKEQLLTALRRPFDKFIIHKNSQELLPHEKNLLDRQITLLQELLKIAKNIPSKLEKHFVEQEKTWNERLTELNTFKTTYAIGKDVANVQKRYGKMPTINPNASPEKQAAQLKTLQEWLEKIEQADNEIGQQILEYYTSLPSNQQQPGGDCFAIAKGRVQKIWAKVSGGDLYDNLPPSTVQGLSSRKIFNMLWNCVPSKQLPPLYNGLGSAGAMAWAGKGDLVTEEEIWAGKLETGAVIQVWKQKSDFELISKGENIESYGHSFIFLNYVYEEGKIVRMRIADQGTGWDSEEGINRFIFGYWVAANLK
ncbi:MAG: hypothetical protein ACRBFS_22255 [Aureispira sp.]